MKRRDFVASAAGVGTLSLFPAGLAGLEREKGPAGLERRALGKIEPHRKGVFLACKTQKRTKEEANAELESSLRKMRTDHFDLYQHHAVTTKADAERILGPGGAMEAFEAAQSGQGPLRRLFRTT